MKNGASDNFLFRSNLRVKLFLQDADPSQNITKGRTNCNNIGVRNNLYCCEKP